MKETIFISLCWDSEHIPDIKGLLVLCVRGVVLLEANFEAIPINQCAYDGGLFSGTHRCNRQSTECKYIPSSTLQWGSYLCVCKEGYSFPTPNAANKFFDGRSVERAYLEFVRNVSSDYSNELNCLPMSTTPASTTPLGGEGDPIVAFDFLVRGIPLGIQSFCMTVSLVIAIVILCFRKTKVMRTSIWALLEMLLLGAILLYATVVLQYFEPTTTTCLLLPWLREMGFAIVYGVLVLKIYRILAEFQSRKAHRVHVRDKDLLKYLAVIMIVVIAYMSAWTAVNMDHLRNNSTILERLYTKERLAYTLCRAMWWDYVIEAGEFIFLCFGIYMCYCIRSAPTEYSEGRFITGAICYEAIVSTIFYILRHLWWYEMHPDHLFLMFFLRCQLTVTVVLLIILGPKLWYAHRPPDEDHGRSRAYSQSDVQDSSSPETMKLNVGISSNGDVEVGEISLTEMDPEDIRAELKRLYTQLQIYKTKTMRKDNPHISKRRGGRKQTHRRFSLQAFHHKHRHHHEHDHEHEMSKTPEESTNSAEAMAFTIEPSVKEEPNEGRALPSVSFKPGHK
ncbi:G-protein coupled receptor 158 [Biomphalaria glabrata]